MARKTDGASKADGTPKREDRLKVALKANLARRKAQAKARQATYNKKPAQNGED